MKKSYWWIVISYGAFLGWLLSFPYNGPVLRAISAAANTAVEPLSLIYTFVPVLFLFVFFIYNPKENHLKTIMILCIFVCLTGTLIIFLSKPHWWYFTLGIMGICSVIYIITWSSYYTRQIPINKKIKIMALVIIVGNIIYYLINIGLEYFTFNTILFILTGVLSLSLWASYNLKVDNPIEIHFESEPFPTKLILTVCLFLFIIKLNGGIAIYVIYPSYKELYGSLSAYYGMLPYILVLLVLYCFSNKIPRMQYVYFGTSLMGMAYLSYGIMQNSILGYFLTETLLQMGWVLLHLFWWTFLGEFASIYGRPLKICSFAFFANLLAVFCGGVLGIYILKETDNYYFACSSYAFIVIFVSFLIVPWLSKRIEEDFFRKLNTDISGETIDNKNRFIIDKLTNLEGASSLTPREMQIAEILLQGYTNNEIAQKLHISENTMKIHARNIYSKMHVSNKRELLQLLYTE